MPVGLGLLKGAGRVARVGVGTSSRRSGGSGTHVSLVVVYNIIPEVIAAVEVTAALAVKEVSELIALDAQGRAPVRTGNLRSSIGSSSQKKEGEVFAGAEYAAFVEYGTYKMPAQPFLGPAVARYAPEFAKRVGTHWLRGFGNK